MANAVISLLQVGDAVAQTAVVSLLQVDGAPAAANVARVALLQVDANPPLVNPNAPSNVAGAATGGTTANLTLTDNSGGAAQHRWQVQIVGGSWVDATVVGGNPSAAGVTAVDVTGLTAASEYLVRARAELFGGVAVSAYAQGASSFWQDNVAGGGGEIPSAGIASVQVAAAGQVLGTVAAAATAASTSATIAAVGQVLGVVSAVAAVSDPVVQVGVTASGQVLGAVSASVTASTAAPPATPELASVALLKRWPDKDPRETTTISFVFPGAVSEVLMTVDAYSLYGIEDLSPDTIFSGAFVVSGDTVTRPIGEGGVDLVDYYVDCVATVDGQRMVASLVLPVRMK